MVSSGSTTRTCAVSASGSTPPTSDSRSWTKLIFQRKLMRSHQEVPPEHVPSVLQGVRHRHRIQ